MSHDSRGWEQPDGQQRGTWDRAQLEGCASRDRQPGPRPHSPLPTGQGPQGSSWARADSSVTCPGDPGWGQKGGSRGRGGPLRDRSRAVGPRRLRRKSCVCPAEEVGAGGAGRPARGQCRGGGRPLEEPGRRRGRPGCLGSRQTGVHRGPVLETSGQCSLTAPETKGTEKLPEPGDDAPVHVGSRMGSWGVKTNGRNLSKLRAFVRGSLRRGTPRRDKGRTLTEDVEGGVGGRVTPFT